MAAETLEGTSDRVGAAGGKGSKSSLAQNGRVGDTPDTLRPGLTEAETPQGAAATEAPEEATGAQSVKELVAALYDSEEWKILTPEGAQRAEYDDAVRW